MGWYLEALVNYANFSDRATRSEYWWFTLFNGIITIVLAAAVAMARATDLLVLVYLAAMVVPSLSVSVRRLHDTDRSGWWLLLGLVPFGSLVLLVFYVSPSTPGTNSYGPEGGSRTSSSPEKLAARNTRVEDEVMNLYQLYKSGALSSEEYQARRQALFSRR